MQPENGLRNKRVIIIGGSSGIGLAVAVNAASRGAKIIIASSNAQRLQKAVECIEAEAKGETLDVSNERSVETFFANHGPIDHLVYTAGDSLQLCATRRLLISVKRTATLNCAIDPCSLP